MEFLDKIMLALNNNVNDPALIYMISGVIFIISMIIFRKILYISMVIVAIGVAYYAFCYFTGYEINSEYIPNIQTIHNFINSLTSSGTAKT